MSVFLHFARIQASKLMKPAALTSLLAMAAAVVMALHSQALVGSGGTCMLEDIPIASRSSVASASITNNSSALTLDLIDSLEQRCMSINKDMNKELKAVNNEVPQAGSDVLGTTVNIFKNLANFEVDYVDAMLSVENTFAAHAARNASTPSAGQDTENGAERTFHLSLTKRSMTRVCFLQVITMARRLASSLPREANNANGALGCKWGLLSGIEARAVRDAEADASARALAHLGAHWSELATTGRSAAPLFGTGPVSSGRSAWVRDRWGSVAPADIVHSEDYLFRSAQAPGFKNPALSNMQARRLEFHAKFLDVQGQHDASAQRYRAMAKLAEDAGNAALSAHALSQLSHSLKLRGSHEEAIVAAKDAVALTMDPLARFVLATARLSSGLLTTDTSIKAAEVQLRAVEGQLPSEELEVQRASMHSELMMWQWISNGDIKRCQAVPDAARFVICTLAKLVF